MKGCYVYIMNTRAKILHIGMTKDIVKALKFYENMPVISLQSDFRLFKLIYLVEYINHKDAKNWLLELSKTPKNGLIKIIKDSNPELIELKPGENITL